MRSRYSYLSQETGVEPRREVSLRREKKGSGELKWIVLQNLICLSVQLSLAVLLRAAEKLGLSDPTASRCLSSLEQRLGTRLLERTTRRLWLTDAGRAYYRRCEQLLADLAEADAEATDSTKRPSGVLSVTSSPSFGMMHLAPILPQFQRLYLADGRKSLPGS